MKLLITTAITAFMYTGGAMAQRADDKPMSIPPVAPTLGTGNEAKHAREADVRHCLNLDNERAIIRCAEPYRYRGTR